MRCHQCLEGRKSQAQISQLTQGMASHATDEQTVLKIVTMVKLERKVNLQTCQLPV